MEKLHYSIVIAAPKQKVWETMLNDDTYRKWTEVFNPGKESYYEGSWETGSDMQFLGPEEDGTVSGMISRIKESRPYDFLSIQHLGELNHGVEKAWEMPAGEEALENYTFNEVEGGTEVLVGIDVLAEYKDMFNGMWPNALEKLKEITEAA